MGNIRENNENGGVVLTDDQKARLNQIYEQYTQQKADKMFEMVDIVKKEQSLDEKTDKLLEIVKIEAKDKATEYLKNKGFSPELIEQITTDYETDDQQILDKRQEFSTILKQLEDAILEKKKRQIDDILKGNILGQINQMIEAAMCKHGTPIKPFPLTKDPKQQKDVDKMIKEFGER